MAKPWEKYQAAPAPQSTEGPWKKYQPATDIGAATAPQIDMSQVPEEWRVEPQPETRVQPRLLGRADPESIREYQEAGGRSGELLRQATEGLRSGNLIDAATAGAAGGVRAAYDFYADPNKTADDKIAGTMATVGEFSGVNPMIRSLDARLGNQLANRGLDRIGLDPSQYTPGQDETIAAMGAMFSGGRGQIGSGKFAGRAPGLPVTPIRDAALDAVSNLTGGASDVAIMAGKPIVEGVAKGTGALRNALRTSAAPVTAVPPTAAPRPSRGAAANAPPLNAVPAGPFATKAQRRIANDTAKITARIMRSARIRDADVKGYLPGAIQRYKALNDETVPLAFFLKRDVRDHFPEAIADEVATKLDTWGRERNAATGPQDTSRKTIQTTIKTLREGQRGFLREEASRNLGKGKLIQDEDRVVKRLREIGRKGYEPVLQHARDAMSGVRKPTAAEVKGFEELREVLQRPVFKDRIPNDVKMTAEAEGFDLMELIERDPVTAAHWLQSNLRALEDAAEDVGGKATPASLAYAKMRDAVLEPLKKAAPGYEGSMTRYGHEFGAKQAVQFGRGVFTIAKSAYDTARKIRQFKKLTTKQKAVALKSVRDEFLNEFRGTPENKAAKLTRMQQEGSLDFLEQLGPRGKRMAAAIRKVAEQNENIRPIEQASGSPTHSNIEGAKAAQAMVQSPVNKAVGAFGDKTSWPMTIAGDVVLASSGLPPVLTASKAITSGIDRFGRPGPKTLSRATEGLYGLPPKNTGNALTAPPRKSGPPKRTAKPKATDQGPQDMGALLKQLDEAEANAKTRGGPEGQRILDEIAAERKRLEALPKPPSRGPVHQQGFGGSKPPLPMDEGSRKAGWFEDLMVNKLGMQTPGMDDIRRLQNISALFKSDPARARVLAKEMLVETIPSMDDFTLRNFAGNRGLDYYGPLEEVRKRVLEAVKNEDPQELILTLDRIAFDPSQSGSSRILAGEKGSALKENIIAAGIGSFAGNEIDPETGEMRFDPAKAALGMAAGVGARSLIKAAPKLANGLKSPRPPPVEARAPDRMGPPGGKGPPKAPSGKATPGPGTLDYVISDPSRFRALSDAEFEAAEKAIAARIETITDPKEIQRLLDIRQSWFRMPDGTWNDQRVAKWIKKYPTEGDQVKSSAAEMLRIMDEEAGKVRRPRADVVPGPGATGAYDKYGRVPTAEEIAKLREESGPPKPPPDRTGASGGKGPPTNEPRSISRNMSIADVQTPGGPMRVTADVWVNDGKVIVSPDWPSNVFADAADAMGKRLDELRGPNRGLKVVDEEFGKPPPSRPDWSKQNPELSRKLVEDVAARFIGIVRGNPAPAHVIALLDGFDNQYLAQLLKQAKSRNQIVLRTKDGGELAIVDRDWLADNPDKFYRQPHGVNYDWAPNGYGWEAAFGGWPTKVTPRPETLPPGDYKIERVASETGYTYYSVFDKSGRRVSGDQWFEGKRAAKDWLAKVTGKSNPPSPPPAPTSGPPKGNGLTKGPPRKATGPVVEAKKYVARETVARLIEMRKTAAGKDLADIDAQIEALTKQFKGPQRRPPPPLTPREQEARAALAKARRQESAERARVGAKNRDVRLAPFEQATKKAADEYLSAQRAAQRGRAREAFVKDVGHAAIRHPVATATVLAGTGIGAVTAYNALNKKPPAKEPSPFVPTFKLPDRSYREDPMRNSTDRRRVIEVQTILRRKGAALQPDGIMIRKDGKPTDTQRIVAQVQEANGLPVTGLLDDETLDVIYQMQLTGRPSVRQPERLVGPP